MLVMVMLSLPFMVCGCHKLLQTFAIMPDEADARIGRLELQLESTTDPEEVAAIQSEISSLKAVEEFQKKVAGGINTGISLLLAVLPALGLGGWLGKLVTAKKWVKVAAHLATIAEKALPTQEDKDTATRKANQLGIGKAVHQTLVAAGLTTKAKQPA